MKLRTLVNNCEILRILKSPLSHKTLFKTLSKMGICFGLMVVGIIPPAHANLAIYTPPVPSGFELKAVKLVTFSELTAIKIVQVMIEKDDLPFINFLYCSINKELLSETEKEANPFYNVNSCSYVANSWVMLPDEESAIQFDNQFIKEFKLNLALDHGFGGIFIGSLATIAGTIMTGALVYSGFKSFTSGKIGFFKVAAGSWLLYYFAKMVTVVGILTWNDILATWSVEKRIDHELKNLDEELHSKWTAESTQRPAIENMMISIRRALEATLSEQGTPLSI